MTRVWPIFKREFGGYWNSLMAYFFLVLLLGAIGFVYVWLSLFRTLNAEMTDYFTFFKIALWLFIPAITMRMWSEEKKLGTLELMMTMPVKDSEAVIGKFLASFAFLIITLLLSMATIPTALSYAGDPDWGPIIGGYLGLLFMGGAFIAVGLAISSMTENQFIAFILSSIICLLLLAVGELVMLAPLPGFVTGLINWADAGTHFESIGRGVIDSRDVVYYLSVICFFLFLNYRSVTARRWK